MSDYYTTKDLCDMFNVDRHTVERWKKKGDLLYIKIGRQYFYPKDQEALKAKREGQE